MASNVALSKSTEGFGGGLYIALCDCEVAQLSENGNIPGPIVSTRSLLVSFLMLDIVKTHAIAHRTPLQSVLEF